MSKTLHITVTDPVGLYATPATELVSTMKAFHSDVRLTYAAKTVNLKSLMGVLSLGIPTKADIIITADGPDEADVMERVSELVKELEIGTPTA